MWRRPKQVGVVLRGLERENEEKRINREEERVGGKFGCGKDNGIWGFRRQATEGDLVRAPPMYPSTWIASVRLVLD